MKGRGFLRPSRQSSQTAAAATASIAARPSHGVPGKTASLIRRPGRKERGGTALWRTARLKDPRSRADVTRDPAFLIRTAVLLAAQGWRDPDDAGALCHDPAFRLSVSSAAGRRPLAGPGLASQPKLLRFTALMAAPREPPAPAQGGAGAGGLRDSGSAAGQAGAMDSVLSDLDTCNIVTDNSPNEYRIKKDP